MVGKLTSRFSILAVGLVLATVGVSVMVTEVFFFFLDFLVGGTESAAAPAESDDLLIRLAAERRFEGELGLRFLDDGVEGFVTLLSTF